MPFLLDEEALVVGFAWNNSRHRLRLEDYTFYMMCDLGCSVNAHMFPGYLRSAANRFMRFEMRSWSLIVSIVAAGVCGMMSHRRIHVKAALCCLKKAIQLVRLSWRCQDCLSSESSMSCTFMVCLLLALFSADTQPSEIAVGDET